MTNSVSIDKLFPVTSAVINTGGNGLTMAGVFLDTNPLIPNNPTQRVISFTSASDVADVFGDDSEEYEIANNYFLGFDSSSIKPSIIYFARYIDEEIDAYIQGNAVSTTLAQFQAITAGDITFNVNGLTYAVTGIDLSGATSFSNVGALVLADLISAHALFADATLEYSSDLNAFKFITGLGTGTDTITWCANSALAAALGFQNTPVQTGVILPNTGYLSQGSAAQSLNTNMTAVLKITKNWASFTNMFDVDDDEDYQFYQDASTWANANGYMFCQWNSVSVANELAWNTLLQQKTWAAVAPNYADLNTAAFVMGTGGCIDYTATNGVAAWAFKSQSGLTPLVDDDEDYDALIAANVNCYTMFSSRSNGYNFYQQGRITGQFKFIQNFYNQMWLSDAIQTSITNAFKAAKIIGYNSQGYGLIYNAIASVMTNALNNGVVTRGNAFSADQIAIMTQQAGLDISSYLSNNGYYIQVQPATGDQRASNIPPVTTLWYTNGGVILTLPVTTIFVE